MSAQAQKFQLFEKKLSLGVRSPCTRASLNLNSLCAICIQLVPSALSEKCEVHLIRVFSRPKNGIMQGTGLFVLFCIPLLSVCNSLMETPQMVLLNWPLHTAATAKRGQESWKKSQPFY